MHFRFGPGRKERMSFSYQIKLPVIRCRCLNTEGAVRRPWMSSSFYSGSQLAPRRECNVIKTQWIWSSCPSTNRFGVFFPKRSWSKNFLSRCSANENDCLNPCASSIISSIILGALLVRHFKRCKSIFHFHTVSVKIDDLNHHYPPTRFVIILESR